MLQPGDILLAFTGRSSEAMTTDGEEWSEGGPDRTPGDVPPYARYRAGQLPYEAADEFAAGAPQHDDMSLVLLKMFCPSRRGFPSPLRLVPNARCQIHYPGFFSVRSPKSPSPNLNHNDSRYCFRLWAWETRASENPEKKKPAKKQPQTPPPSPKAGRLRAIRPAIERVGEFSVDSDAAPVHEATTSKGRIISLSSCSSRWQCHT